MATENIVTGKFYRILKNASSKTWDRISFWTHADDVSLSNGTTLSSDLSTKQTKINATQTDFAQVESSSTSAHAYTKGQMLIYNNQLYRVKAAIAVGNTLSTSTNIEVASVSTLSSMLTANNGNQFYFDVKNGQYGFYPTASKTSSQFVPFGGTSPTKLLCKAFASSASFASEDGIYIASVVSKADALYSVGTEYSGYILKSSTNSQMIDSNPLIFSVSGSAISVIIGPYNTNGMRVTYNSGNINIVQTVLRTDLYNIVCLKFK